MYGKLAYIMDGQEITSRYKLFEFSADFDRTGHHVAPDWRYDLLGDYLSSSVSYELVHRHRLGQKMHHPRPADYDVVSAVYDDFGPVRKFADMRWWQNTGMRLFGIAAPRPSVQVVGELTDAVPSISIKKHAHDALVLALPKVLTHAEVMRQLKVVLEKYEFAIALPEKIVPKYKLYPSKLQKVTLLKGLEALRLYKRGVSLWRIGNQLELNGNKCMPVEVLEKMTGQRGVEAKAELAKAARRLIRKAAMIAENAARGRFPCDTPFVEAMVDSYSERKAGRPHNAAGQNAGKKR